MNLQLNVKVKSLRLLGHARYCHGAKGKRLAPSLEANPALETNRLHHRASFTDGLLDAQAIGFPSFMFYDVL